MYTGNDMTQGVLAQLLGSFDPARRQQLMQQQQQARQQHQQVLDEPMPDQGPVRRMVGDYLRKYGASGQDWNSMASAVGEETFRLRDMQLEEQKRRELAAANKAKNAGQDLSAEDAMARAVLSTAGRSIGGRGAMGGQPSPEQLRTVYTGARNEAAQISKDYDWESAEHRANWIEQQANDAVENYVHQWTTQPTGPRGVMGQFGPAQGGTPPIEQQAQQLLQAGQQAQAQQAQAPQQMPQQMPTQMPGAQTMGQPQRPNVSAAGIQSAQQPNPQAGGVPTFNIRPDEMAPQDRQRIEQLAGQVRQGNPQGVEQQMAEMAKSYGMLTQGGGQPPAPQAPGALSQVAEDPGIKFVPAGPEKDIPRRERAKAGGAALAKADAGHYEEVITQANAAANQFEAFNQLEKIDPVTNKFSAVYQGVGEVLSALGQDPNTPIIKNAINTRDADMIISQLRNASLKLENGVQTASDEKRIAAELPKITDMPQVWKMALKLGKEASLRRMERAGFYQASTEQDTANLSKLQSLWNRQIKSDPLTQYYGGQLIFRSDFLQGIKRLNPGMTDAEALEDWKALEGEYQARGGRR